MPVALRNCYSLCPDLVFAGLYDSVLLRALKMAEDTSLDHGDHLYHLASFLRDLLNLGYCPIEINATGVAPVLVLLDCPSQPVLKWLGSLISPKKVFILLAEHPAYQPSETQQVPFPRVTLNRIAETTPSTPIPNANSPTNAHLLRQTPADEQEAQVAEVCLINLGRALNNKTPQIDKRSQS